MQHVAITPGLGTLPRNLATLQADLLLIREKSLPIPDLLTLAKQIRALLPNTKILISERLDIALAANLDGVHLPARPGQLTPAQIRSRLPNAIVTKSVHTLAEVETAKRETFDLLLFGPVFGKFVEGVEVTPPQGLTRLAEACRLAAPLPVFALGNVTQATLAACEHAGAAGVASIRMSFPSSKK